MKLHLGCGNVILPGYVNVDAVAGPGVDVVDDVRTLSAFPHECADVIYASHVLDHMGRNEVPSVLAEWHRRLRPGGVLRLAVSDFAAAVTLYQEGVPLPKLLGHIVGGHKTAYDRHGVAFDDASLRAALADAGFVDVRPWDWRSAEHGSHDDFSQAYEPHMAKDTGRLMSLNLESERPATAGAGRPDVIAWVIGDSNSPVFSGSRVHPKYLDQHHVFFDRRGNFGVEYVGPWLAWRLGEEDRMAQVRDAAAHVLAIAARPLIFSMGEIDYRTRLACPSEGTTMTEAVHAVAARYTSALVATREHFQVPVAAFDPPPPTHGPIYSTEFPARGSYTERRAASDEFSRVLRQLCQESGIGCISLRERLADGPERVNLSCFCDSFHLNPDEVYGDLLVETKKWLKSL